MRKVKIMIDSSVDLPKDLIEKHDLEVIPFHILFGEESFRDGVNITAGEMYERVRQTKTLPKTAAVSIDEFKERFDKYVEQDMDIFLITLSSKISSNYQNAYLASQDYDEGRVVVCDSLHLSGSIALLVLKAIKFRDQGMSAVKIKEEVEKLIPKMNTQFVIRTLEYLHKGGRCSTLAKWVGTVLSLKIQIKMKDGKLEAYKKTPGKMSRAIDVMLDDFFKLEAEGKLDKEFVFVTHTYSHQMKDYILEKLEESEIEIENLIVSEAGTVISSHCGEGTIGILYLEK